MDRPEERPWVIAHRGASAAAPENTTAAFRMAADLGADAVELDARRTADGVIVVHHDDAIGGTAIVSSSLARIRAEAPEVPTLDEALTACAGMWVNVEIKNSPRDLDWDPEDRVTASIVDVAVRSGRDVEISSFNAATLARVRAVAPGIPTGWLFEGRLMPATAAVELAAAVGHRAIHPDAATLAGPAAAEVVAAAHGAGLWVICWTVDDPREAERLAAAGVDGIITNDPGAIRKTLDDP